MSRIVVSVLMGFALLLSGQAQLYAAETRTPTPEEFREILKQYNGQGRSVAAPVQPPKGAVEFNRAVTIQSKKDPSAAELKEAASLYQVALDAGIPQAGTNLALLYLEGKGVKKDVKKALALLQAAAKKNESQADVVLARLYLIGKDVPKDEKKAEALLNKAAKAGNQNAVKMLAEYKEWKKKNELSMKQYQDLMKQLQANQTKPVVTQPLQILPRSPEAAPRFPVIPGYGYVSGSPVPLPDFMAPVPRIQPQPLNVIPAGTPPVPQPVSIIPPGGTPLAQPDQKPAQTP